MATWLGLKIANRLLRQSRSTCPYFDYVKAVCVCLLVAYIDSRQLRRPTTILLQYFVTDLIYHQCVASLLLLHLRYRSHHQMTISTISCMGLIYCRLATPRSSSFFLKKYITILTKNSGTILMVSPLFNSNKLSRWTPHDLMFADTHALYNKS